MNGRVTSRDCIEVRRKSGNRGDEKGWLLDFW